jgi:hypothetical protein
MCHSEVRWYRSGGKNVSFKEQDGIIQQERSYILRAMRGISQEPVQFMVRDGTNRKTK